MTGPKTKQQQKRIINDEIDTSNKGKDFDPTMDLQKSKTLRERERESQNIQPHKPIEPDDRSILRGYNQESDHNKS
ncbi:hypothetical protein [Rhizobium sp. L1K21]|uniref:hypothetical protein n=1 Tax=Rhizobium sp. L1K21 TaxID=2954933 RepID=UPI0020928392|nr:hypothetical protein [Rhizobium sp. L1K21]MCO6188582.1 hypothetical protein [Rhizobium sp. L1K21]